MPSGSRRSRKKRAARRRGAAAPPGQSLPAEAANDEVDAAEVDVDAADGSARPARATRRRAEPEGAPPPPWGSFPLVELLVLAGIVVLVLGFFFSSGGTQAALIVTGLLLCSIAGLEVAVREHVSGYRSHTLVLAGVPAVAALAALFYLAPSSLAPAARLGVGLVVFGLAAWGLTTLFQRRSGGHAFRVRAPRKR